MKLEAAKVVSASELAEWRRKVRRRVLAGEAQYASSDMGGPVGDTPPAGLSDGVQPTADGEGAVFEVDRSPPLKPADAFEATFDYLWKWANASKESWDTAIALFRKHNGTMVAHMTDDQLRVMLKEKVEQSLKEVMIRLGRGDELKIRIGGS